ncbi:sulfite exporter TauE/SafE family protein [Sinomicrobium sp.]
MNTELLLVLSAGIFAGFYIQTVVGFAGSLVALPILLFGMQLPDAISYISIFYLISSGYLIYKEWKNIDKKIILQMAAASVIGVILGIAVLAFSKPTILKKGLGVFIILYVLYNVFGKKKIQLEKRGIFGFGIMGGFFSGVFSTGGPLYVMCIENTIKDVKAFRATMIGVLGLVTVARVPVLAAGGILSLHHFKIALFVLPFFFLAQVLGRRTFDKINEGLFKKVLMVLLCMSGVAMIF